MAIYEITNRPKLVDFECNDDILKRTIQNAKNLLMTRMGEVPFDRYRGFDSALYDLPMQEMQAQLLPELERLMLYEPDVTVVDATAERDERGEVVITVALEINLGGDDGRGRI